jgi:glycosyltransferase involved in cell wall biosynthesis
MIKKTQNQIIKDWPLASEPLVSIVCVTYNHEKYISDAIDGFLMQETSFPFEIIIGEDCSTDGTAKIVKKYTEIYPDIITSIIRPKNIGGGSNFSDCIQRARGSFIAYCDGDDYWIDEKKIEKQANHLRDNKCTSLCFHKVSVLQREGEIYSYKTPKKKILKFNDILFVNYIPMCSIMFNSEFLPAGYFSTEINNFKLGDIPMQLTLTNRAHAYFSSEVMGVYRRHESGITANSKQIKSGRETYILVYLYLRKHLDSAHWLALTIILLKTRLGAIKDFIKR